MSPTLPTNYNGETQLFLENIGAEVWDRLDITTITDQTIVGTLLPRYLNTPEATLSLKLGSGYNTGVRLRNIRSVKVLSKGTVEEEGELPSATTQLFQSWNAQGRNKVTVLSCGGTIASRLDYRTGAVVPTLTSDDLLRMNPELAELATIETQILLNELSEDLTITHWLEVARNVAKALNNGAHGVVVAHGTDTLAYGAATLALALRALSGPVVITGAQRSTDRPSSDQYQNLRDSVYVAAHANRAEVVVCLHQNSSDGYSALHRPTWVRKMHSSRRDAFRTINGGILGHVSAEERQIQWTGTDDRDQGGQAGRKTTRTTWVDERFDQRVTLLYTYPGMDPAVVESVISQGYKGLVLAGTGMGHCPRNLLPVLRQIIKEGVVVVMTTQTLAGTTGLQVYRRGRELLQLGVLPGGYLLPETAFVKLCFVLGHAQTPEAVKDLFNQNIAGERLTRELIGAFP